MADPIIVKVSALAELTDLAPDDLIVGVDVSEPQVQDKTKKLPARNIKIFNANQITDGILTASKYADSSITTAKLVNRSTVVYLKVLGSSDIVAPGDGALYWCIPEQLNGAKFVKADIACVVTGSSGSTTVQIVIAGTDRCSTKPAMAAGAYNSYAGTRGIANIAVSTGQQLRVDVDSVAVGTKGLDVILVFEL